MNALQRQERAAVDLGLLSRVLCHELNNLVANQRGYARLLTQHGSGAASPRWLAELAGAADGLQGLVAAVQQWSRRAAGAPERDDASCQWPPSTTLSALAERMARQGCAMSELGLCRVLAIVAGHAQAGIEEWTGAPGATAPAEGAVLGGGDPAGLPLGLSLPDRSGGNSAQLWADSAGHILPAGQADDDAWLRALVLGLLRQNRADLFHPPGTPARVELWLPVKESTLDGSRMGA